MKNRKKIIVAFMLCAVMLLGIGYAALTDNLTITGEATVKAEAAQNQWEQDIYFLSATAPTVGGTPATTGTSGIADTAAVGTSNNDSASFEVKSLIRKGEKATFVFTIKNDGNTEYDANITVDSGYPTNTNETYFDVTYDYGTSIVPVGGTLDITVTVELINDPVENLTAAFTLNLTATSETP